MAEIADRLVPLDGLNDYRIEFARMEAEGDGGCVFWFRVLDHETTVAEFQVRVPPKGQSLDRMMVQAHDKLINVLRQLLFRADWSRSAYEKRAATS